MRFDVTSLVGLLAVMWAVSLGCGLAAERVLRLRLPNGLLLPLGLCVSFVVIYPGYVAGVGDPLAIALLLTVAVAGLVFARDGILNRVNPGWAGAAGAAAYVLYMLPVIAHGSWTWSGYNFVNDSAFEMLLADHIRGYGTVLGNIPESTEQQFLLSYFNSAYPLGTQSLLGTYGAILRVPSAVVYQSFIAMLAAATAISFATIVERLTSARRAALLAFVAVAANLTYQYGLQGSLKEIGLLATLAATAALGQAAIAAKRPYAGAVLVAIGAAASLDVYSAVALPFLGALLLFGILAFVLSARRPPTPRWLAPVAAGVALTALFALPTLTSLSTFFDIAKAGQGATGVGAGQFGQLLRKLPVSQISGVWLAGEYRTAVEPEPAAALTLAATVAILVLAFPGALWAAWRRAIAPLAALAGVGLVLLVVFPRVSPYAQGKLLAISSPAVLLAALLAAASVRGRARVAGGLLIGLLAVAVLASDILAYGRARVAPTQRMLAITAAAEHFRGEGLVLWNEFEEYAKYFGKSARVNVPFEALTQRQVKLRVPQSFYGHYFDLDEELLSFVEQYPLIVTRRSPAASRPPADYRLVYENRYYLGWRRTAHPEVLAHLPEQQEFSPAAAVSCPALSRLIAHAPAGSQLIAPIPPALSWFEPLYSRDRSFAWGVVPGEPGAVATNGPGHASGRVRVREAGEYAVWVQGDFPHPIAVSLDGRRVGVASGSETPLQWQQVATLELRPGTYTLRVVRGSGHRYFGPGEWQSGVIGAVALQRQLPETMQTLPLSRWRTLCGTRRDWVEVVRP